MTRKEAIFYIKELQKTCASMDKKVAEAVDIAIEALERANHAYILTDEDGNIECSNCGSGECWGNYCMNCGAKMEERHETY